jgi:hypothetical protein
MITTHLMYNMITCRIILQIYIDDVFATELSSYMYHDTYHIDTI